MENQEKKEPKVVEASAPTTKKVFDAATYGLIECPAGFAQLQHADDENIIVTVSASLLTEKAKVGDDVPYLDDKYKIVALNAPK